MESNHLKIGMIGLDTSHVPAFAELLNDPGHKFHVPGGRIIAAFPGGSKDFELSYSRVEGYTTDLQTRFGVEMMATPEAVAEQCDAIFIESVDGRIHLEQFQKIAAFGKPVFIDKPFTTGIDDANKIIELSRRYRTPVMSSSSLRYAEKLQEAIQDEDNGHLIGADCYGPMNLESTQPGLFWYGIHMVEMLFTILGTGCVTVTAETNDDHDVIVGKWKDGRIGTIRGNRKGNNEFGALVHREKGTQFADIKSGSKPFYASMLEEVMVFFKEGKSPVPLEETLEIIKFIEAANESRSTMRSIVLEDILI